METYILVTEKIEKDTCYYGRSKSLEKFMTSKHNGKKEIVTSMVELEQSLKGKKDTSRTLLVIPEIKWGEELFAGYKVAYDLLSKIKDEIPFKLIFVSALPRKHSILLAGKRYADMANAFPYIYLKDIKEENDLASANLEKALKNDEISNIHFQLARRLSLDYVAKLSYLRHDTGNKLKLYSKDAEKTESICKMRDNALSLIDRLDESVYTDRLKSMDINLDQLKRKAEEAKAVEDFQKIASDIESIVDSLISDFSNESLNGKMRFPFNVLIIEDDDACRDALYNYFTEICPPSDKKITSVLAYSQEDIKNAREKLKDDIKKYDLAILDLHFLDEEGGWLPFSGLDLYKIIRENNPYCTIRIVTSLPRAELSILTNKFLPGEQPRIFSKGGGKDMLLGAINERISEIEQECKNNQDHKYQDDQDYPDSSIFTLPGIRWYIKYNKEEFNKAMDGAIKEANDNPDKEFDVPSPKLLHSSEHVIKKMQNILTMRRYYIRRYLNESIPITKYNDETKKNDKPTNINRKINNLGLRYTPELCIDRNQRFFKEERDLIAELDKDHLDKTFSDDKVMLIWLDHLKEALNKEEYASQKVFIKNHGYDLEKKVLDKDTKKITHKDFVDFLEICAKEPKEFSYLFLEDKVDPDNLYEYKDIKDCVDENTIKIWNKYGGIIFFRDNYPKIYKSLKTILS